MELITVRMPISVPLHHVAMVRVKTDADQQNFTSAGQRLHDFDHKLPVKFGRHQPSSL